MVLPCSNSKLRAAATQRPNGICGPHDYLTLDVEKDLSELILLELKLHRETEDMKQELEGGEKSFTWDAAYTAIDDCSLKYIYQKNLERFFNACKRKTTDLDHFAIIRRIDLDADSRINKDEFMEAIKPQEPYSKMLLRNRIQARKTMSKQDKDNDDKDKKKRGRPGKATSKMGF